MAGDAAVVVLGAQPPTGETFARRLMTTTGIIVVLLTFFFSFGNVLDLGLYLGVPKTIAWLVAPAIDLTVLGLVISIRYLSMAGVTGRELWPVRLLLIVAGLVMLILNTANALWVRGHLGAAAYDAIGPLLMLAWTEAGPLLLRYFKEIYDAQIPGQNGSQNDTQNGAENGAQKTVFLTGQNDTQNGAHTTGQNGSQNHGHPTAQNAPGGKRPSGESPLRRERSRPAQDRLERAWNKRPNSRTAAELAAAAKCSPSTARKFLKNKQGSTQSVLEVAR